MGNVEKSKNSIIQVLFWFNLIFIVISIFHVTKVFTLIITITNFILIGTFFILNKFGTMFEGLFLTNNMFKNINSMFKE